MSRLSRRSLPEELAGATPYSAMPAVGNPVTVIHTLRGMPRLIKPLLDASKVRYRWGPDRKLGDWPLLYLAFVLSHHSAVQPWYSTVLGHAALWTACGFADVPSLRTVELRFAELEGLAPVFEAQAATLIQKAKARDERVGAWLHFDATESQTHAAPQHDCQPSEPCPTRKTPSSRAPRMRRLSADLAGGLRERRASLPVEVTTAPTLDDGLAPSEISKKYWDARRKVVRFQSGGHWWASRDRDAGTRAYDRGGTVFRAWHGQYGMVAIDHFTHAPIAIGIEPADIQEPVIYEKVLLQAIVNLGGAQPLVVAGDRGLSVKRVFEFNTDRGIASALPYRRQNGSEPKKRTGSAEYDEHGVPKCRHCGGDSDFVRFRVEVGHGRLWFRCRLPTTAGCDRIQTISCRRNYRYLLPLWRTEEAYAAMRTSHQNYEHVHNDLRTRYLVSPNSLAIRPKRIGIGVHRLRAAAALFIEWVRLMTTVGRFGRRNYATKTTSPKGMPGRIAAARRALRTPPPVAGTSPPVALSPPPAV